MLASSAIAQAQPWMNPTLSPDKRAALLEPRLTLDERISLVHCPMAMPILGFKVPPGALLELATFPVRRA